VGETLAGALEISAITRLEVHGPAAEIANLKEPLADYSPQYFELEYSIRG
jgi:hypothetical protein